MKSSHQVAVFVCLAQLLLFWSLAAAEHPVRHRTAGVAIAREFNWSIEAWVAAARGRGTIVLGRSSLRLADGRVYEPWVRGVPVLVEDGARTEAVAITSSSCAVSRPRSCRLGADFAFSHYGRLRVRSGSGGLQEAIDYLARRGGGAVLLTRDWSAPVAALALAAGSGSVEIVDERGGGRTRYVWDGLGYARAAEGQGEGGVLGAAGVRGIFFADQFTGMSCGARADAAAGSVGNGPGLVVIPPACGAGVPSFRNPAVSLFDLRLGTPAAPESLRSFDYPALLLRMFDDSPETRNSAAQADDRIAPMVRLETTESGRATMAPMYFFSRQRASAAPGTQQGDLYGLIGAVDAQTGSRPGLVANDLVWGLDNGYSIASISRDGRTVTATITFPAGAGDTLVPGDWVHVSGVSDASFDSGLGFTVEAVGPVVDLGRGRAEATVSWASSAPPAVSSGGTIAVDTRGDFGFELDSFNDAKDPGPLTPVGAENNLPVWGFVSTGNGAYPGTAAFFSDSSATRNVWYNGFVCGDAQGGCFVAGYPKASGNVGLRMQFGFLSRPVGVATAAANFDSVAVAWQDSVWSGTGYREPTFSERMVAGRGANAASSLVLSFEGRPVDVVAAAGQDRRPGGSAAAPAYSFIAAPGSGWFLDGLGRLAGAESGSERLFLTSGGVLGLVGAAGTAQLEPTGAAVLRLPSGVGTLATTTGALDPSSLAVGADAPMTSAPRMVWGVFLAGPLTASWTAGEWTPDRPVVITRVQAVAKTAPRGCGTDAAVRVGEGGASVSLVLSRATADSGPVAIGVGPGRPVFAAVVTGAAGCASYPADVNLAVQYRMR